MLMPLHHSTQPKLERSEYVPDQQQRHLYHRSLQQYRPKLKHTLMTVTIKLVALTRISTKKPTTTNETKIKTHSG